MDVLGYSRFSYVVGVTFMSSEMLVHNSFAVILILLVTHVISQHLTTVPGEEVEDHDVASHSHFSTSSHSGE